MLTKDKIESDLAFYKNALSTYDMDEDERTYLEEMVDLLKFILKQSKLHK